MKNILKILVSFLSIGVLGVGLMAQPAGAARYDKIRNEEIVAYRCFRSHIGLIVFR